MLSRQWEAANYPKGNIKALRKGSFPAHVQSATKLRDFTRSASEEPFLRRHGEPPQPLSFSLPERALHGAEGEEGGGGGEDGREGEGVVGSSGGGGGADEKQPDTESSGEDEDTTDTLESSSETTTEDSSANEKKSRGGGKRVSIGKVLSPSASKERVGVPAGESNGERQESIEKGGEDDVVDTTEDTPALPLNESPSKESLGERKSGPVEDVEDSKVRQREKEELEKENEKEEKRKEKEREKEKKEIEKREKEEKERKEKEEKEREKKEKEEREKKEKEEKEREKREKKAAKEREKKEKKEREEREKKEKKAREDHEDDSGDEGEASEDEVTSSRGNSGAINNQMIHLGFRFFPNDTSFKGSVNPVLCVNGVYLSLSLLIFISLYSY